MKTPSSNIADLPSSIKLGIESRLKDLHTSMPGIIESFDASTQTASIQPAIKRIFKSNDGQTELLVPSPLPLLINVPIQFPRGGGFSLTFPVKKGDECLITFCERGISTWHQQGGVSNPEGKRFHHLSDATAFVGISSIPNKVPNYDATNVQLKADDDSVSITLNADGSLSVDADSDIMATSGADIIAQADGAVDVTAGTVANITAPTINLNGAVNVSGLLSALAGAAVTGAMNNNGVNIGSTHSHNQANDSGGNTEQPVGVPF